MEFVLNRDTTRVGLLVYEKDDVRIWRTKSIKTTGLPALHVYYSFVGGSVIYLGIKKAHAGLNGASHKS